MERLNFTTRVLGQKAASWLQRKEVTQTIRGATSSIVVAYRERRIVHGDEMEIALGGVIIGLAALSSFDTRHWRQLDNGDAERGGFGNRIELMAALRRAGYHFKPIEEYTLYRILFSWF